MEHLCNLNYLRAQFAIIDCQSGSLPPSLETVQVFVFASLSSICLMSPLGQFSGGVEGGGPEFALGEGTPRCDE